MMKNLIKNDCLYLRTWLAAWAALLVVPVLLFAGLRTELGWEPAYWGTLRIALPILFVLQMVYQILLIAMMVQKESPANPVAYWRTRPVSRLGLPVAKLLCIVCFVLLPQILQGALLGWLFPGGVEAVWDGVATTAFLTALLILFVLPAAVLTRNGGQALLLCILIPAGVALLDLLILSRFRIAAQTWMLDFTPSGISLDTILLCLLAICVVLGFRERYRTELGGWRRWRYFVPALLLLALVVNMPPVPKPIPAATFQLPPEAILEVDSVLFKLKTRRPGGGTGTDVSRDRDLWLAGGPDAEYGLSGAVKWSALPAHWLVSVEPVRSYGPDGRVLEAGESRRTFSNTPVIQKPYIHSLFPGYDRENRAVSWSHATKTLVSSRRLNPGNLEWPAEFTTVFAIRVYESEKVPLPFTEGARWPMEGRRVILDQIQFIGDGLTLQLLFLQRGVHSIQETPFEEGLFALHDPKTGKVEFGRRGGGQATNFHKLLSLGRYEITFGDFPISPAGLSRVELYHIRHELIGTDVREVRYRVDSRE